VACHKLKHSFATGATLACFDEVLA